MSVFRYPLHCSIWVLTIVAVGLFVRDLSDRSRFEITESKSAPASQSSAVVILKAHLPAPQNEAAIEGRGSPTPYAQELRRFSEFHSKVLLKDEEAKEKQRLLGNLKTIHWIEAQLSASPKGKISLWERLLMIDFLHEALDWKENPARGEVLDSMERTLSVNNLEAGPDQARKILVGDKMELFSILAREVPHRARALFETTTDRQLSSIFQYAIKRLALTEITLEAR